MESNNNIISSGDTIVKCPNCLRKFHKDNLAGHLRYESKITPVSDSNSKENEVILNKLMKSHSSYNRKIDIINPISEASPDGESVNSAK